MLAKNKNIYKTVPKLFFYKYSSPHRCTCRNERTNPSLIIMKGPEPDFELYDYQYRDMTTLL